MKKYILVGKIPVECNDTLAWSKCFEINEARRVASTEKDGITVSTVFLGVDHNWGEGPPVLFETMIFGGPENEYQERYCTWEEAEEGHKRAVELAFGAEVTTEETPKPKRPIKI